MGATTAAVAAGVGSAAIGAGASMYSANKQSSAAEGASEAQQNYARIAAGDLNYAGTRANQYALDAYWPQMYRYGAMDTRYQDMQNALAANTGLWDEQLQRQQGAQAGYQDLYNQNVNQLGLWDQQRGNVGAGYEDLYNRNAYQLNQWDQQLRRSAPYYQAGVNALQQEQTPFTFSQTDPSYQWRLQQGKKALETSAAAKGNALSGGTMKGMQDYAQGLASTEYANEFNRYLQQNAIYQNIANQGLTAQSQMANALTGEGSTLGQMGSNQQAYSNLMDAILSGRAGTLGQMGTNQNALTNLINSMGNTLSGRGGALSQAQSNLGQWQGNMNSIGNLSQWLGSTLGQNTMIGAGASADAYNTMGNAQANQYINQANALTGGIQGGLNSAMAGYNLYNQGTTQSALMNYLTGGGSGSGYGANVGTWGTSGNALSGLLGSSGSGILGTSYFGA